MRRRIFIKQVSAAGSMGWISSGYYFNTGKQEVQHGEGLADLQPESGTCFQPLERVYLKLKPLKKGPLQIVVTDADGNVYHQQAYADNLEFSVGGTLGTHRISILEEAGKHYREYFFEVNGSTVIDDGDYYSKMFEMLVASLFSSSYAAGKRVRFNHKYYTYFSSWFQDHVFVAQAMRYFQEGMKTGIDLYADGQREDGLIWDNYKHPYTEHQSYWEYRFDYDNFVYRPEDPLSTALFVKVPVENIGEHTFLEAVYDTWMATGDDRWMAGKMDACLKAVAYVTSSPYAWSKKFQLLHRPYTIDRWDFQPAEDSSQVHGGIMGVELGKTKFSIMYGDNLCMAYGCQLLAGMLDHCGRTGEAERIRQLGKGIRNRIDKLAWNGRHYIHHIQEDPSVERNYGINPDIQVTLSNALALNRKLDQDKCEKIIETYQNIRQEMPESSPGEWYCCYPPYEYGWHIEKWSYMNGGVSPIVAGELARGAFESGYENYGVDILQRLYELALKKRNYLKGCYRGKMPDPPARTFEPLDLTPYLNAAKAAGNHGKVPGWIGGEEADLRNLPSGRQNWHGIELDIADPVQHHQKACLVVSSREAYTPEVCIPVHKTSASIYFLHCMNSNETAGTVTLEYADGSEYSRYIQKSSSGKRTGEIGHFWYPEVPETRNNNIELVVGWRGPAKRVKDVGIYIFGLENPQPNKEIASIRLENPLASVQWAVFAISLCDAPVFFMPDIESTIPDHWAAAHVFRGFVEGLAGITSSAPGFKKAVVSPRWNATSCKKVFCTAKWEDSKGYVSYNWIKNPQKIEMEITGCSDLMDLRILLPEKSTVSRVILGGKDQEVHMDKVKNSRYLCLKTSGVGVHRLEIQGSGF